MLRKWTYLFIAGTVASLASCDSLGPDDDPHMAVRLAATATASAQIAAALLGDDGAGGAPLTLDAVDAISLKITAIEAVRTDAEGAESWVSLALSDEGKATIDLMTLPTADADAWRLARGDIPAGTYNGVRLRFDPASATITLNRSVTVGQQTLPAGTHPLEVPSGGQSGIKVPFATIVIGEDAAAEVVLKFDANTSVHTVATGSGKLLMSPVLQSRVSVEED